jgi:PIN domain nuclease of toxin-antitoxin system
LNILLDTHVALWAIVDDSRLSDEAKGMIAAPQNNIWVSVVSLWEIAIKFNLQKGDMPVSGEQASSYFKKAGYRMLAVELEHVLALEKLDNHHQDPFDRLLIAQAAAEPMRLMTHDKLVSMYSDAIIYV